MGFAAKRPCAGIMCPVLLSGSERYCPKHAEKNKQRTNESRRTDEVRSMYKTAVWIRFQQWFIRKHPVCERVIDGVRCLQPSKVAHHFISPRERPDLFTTEENLRAVCLTHHHGGQGAGPDEVYDVREL
jgi:hypothetical protein